MGVVEVNADRLEERLDAIEIRLTTIEGYLRAIENATRIANGRLTKAEESINGIKLKVAAVLAVAGAAGVIWTIVTDLVPALTRGG